MDQSGAGSECSDEMKRGAIALCLVYESLEPGPAGSVSLILPHNNTTATSSFRAPPWH